MMDSNTKINPQLVINYLKEQVAAQSLEIAVLKAALYEASTNVEVVSE